MDSANYASFRQSFYELTDDASTIVITSHYSPDDDSIGSVLSVFQILKNKYPDKNIRIVYTGIPSERHKSFASFEKIEWVDDVANHLGSIDILIMLDASKYGRFSRIPEGLHAVPKTICIDHHASAPDTFTLLLREPTMTSTCELIYYVFDLEKNIDKNIAETVLLGILGDTNNFSHIKPDQSQIFIIAKHLVETVGISIDAFRSRYGGIPKRIIPLLQELVKNTSYENIAGWPDVQYSFITRNIVEEGKYSDEDMSAASHIYIGQYLSRVEGYGWGFVITPRTDNTCRMSGRSLPGSVNVRDLHERLGVGGGHDRASGGSFAEPDPSACIAKVLEWMKSNTPLIG